MVKQSVPLVTAAHILAAVILTVAPLSDVQAQTTEPVLAGLTRSQELPLSGSPFTISGGGLGGAWKVDAGGRLVWTAAEPLRVEPGSAASQGRAQHARRRSKGYKVAQQVLAGVSLGILGFFAGGLTGAVIDGATFSESGMAGFIIGAPVGAAVGATVGVLMVR